MSGPKTAMVLAAGLGTRMRPLTNDRPKALVEVGGRALIDHLLDRLVEAGVTRAVVNVHAFADLLEAHLRNRRDLEILVADERARLLETGGGVKHARRLLGDEPIWVANSDYVWLEGAGSTMSELAARWDPRLMDVCVVVVPKARTQGFDTPGDFFIAEDSRLTHRGKHAEAPLHCFGIEILDPQRVYEVEADAFSLFRVWMKAAEQGRLYGFEADGFWMQVGDPDALKAAEARLAAG